MWSDVAFSTERKEAALAREDRLDEYWNDMLQGRSSMVPHFDEDSEEDAARKVVGFLLDRNNSGFDADYHPLQIQREMVDCGKSLHDTEAGRYVHSELLSANMERLERQRAQLQEEVEKARQQQQEAADKARREQAVILAGSGQVVDQPRKQQQKQPSEDKSDSWTQTILPRLVLRVFGLQLWSSRLSGSARYRYTGSNRLYHPARVVMIKEYFGSMFTINSNDGNGSNNKRVTPSTSTSDLGYQGCY